MSVPIVPKNAHGLLPCLFLEKLSHILPLYPRHISRSFLSTSSFITALRYFAGHTTWYINVLALCSLRMSLLILLQYTLTTAEASLGVLNRIGFAE